MSTVSVTKKTVLIVEDEPIVQAGITQVIENHTDLKITATLDNGSLAVKTALKLKPELILMDIGLQQLDGIQGTKQIKQLLPNTKVIILSAASPPEQVLAAFASGADGYYVKGSSIQRLVNAINTVREGSVYLDGQIADLLIGHQPHQPQLNSSPKITLKEQELLILNLMASGHSNSQIGAQLQLSANTVKSYLQQIFAKLQVSDRVQAAVKACRLGLLTDASQSEQ